MLNFVIDFILIVLINLIIELINILTYPITYLIKISKKKKQSNNKIKRIRFLDFQKGFDKNNNFFTNLLKRYNHNFEVVDKNQDIIIFSVWGIIQLNPELLRYILYPNSKYVFYTAEYESFNKKKIVRNIDLNLTFEYTTKFNNIRLPYWIFNLNIDNKDKNIKMCLTKKNTDKFCCFVFSNSVPHRNNFCKRLSEYRRIDCGGRCLNNIGGRVDDKLEFQKKYKFCIAYENSISDGYTTEKILEAFLSNCIPIYLGSPSVNNDFNPETFINAADFSSEDELINYIIKVDNDDQLYNSYMNKPIFSGRWIEILSDPNETYFKNISKRIME
jgi:hypothetical protein